MELSNNKIGNVRVMEHWGAWAKIVAVKSEKLRITYSESVFVALGIWHTMRMRHIVFCGLSGSMIYFHIIA